MSINEQLELMVYLANIIKNNQHLAKKNKLTAIIGSGKGCFSTPKEADKFISKERDKWDY
jgi:hypothetical protein